MSDSLAIIPITASAGGNNRYIVECRSQQQSMNYAACLNRLRQIDEKTAPSDWAPCDASRRNGTCAAAAMRATEVLEGRSVYFVAREAISNVVDVARQWVSPWFSKKKPAKTAQSALDHIGKVGTLADAVSAMASVPVPAPVIRANESPLDLARRLAAERKSLTQT